MDGNQPDRWITRLQASEREQQDWMNAMSGPRIFLFFWGLIFVLLTYFHQPYFDAPTPVSRLCLLYEICAHGRIEIGDSIRGTSDTAEVNGRYYSDKAP